MNEFDLDKVKTVEKLPWATDFARPEAAATEDVETILPFKALRKEANVQGGALLIYHVIMNVAVCAVMFGVGFVKGFVLAFESGGSVDSELLAEELTNSMMDYAGWGYLLAVAIGMLILLLWKKPGYIRHTIGQRGKRMTVGDFLALLSIGMAAQLVGQLCYLALQGLFALLGLDQTALQEMANMDTGNLSMFLYVGIAAPITEELLFRGLLLRSIAPYGKKLAIFSSAILFALYHANPIQTPYAFFVGLVLAYVALEYHVIWAIAIHLFNNLVFALLLPEALSFLPLEVADGILWACIIGFFLAAVVILLVKRREVAALWQQEHLELWQRRGVFWAPAVVVLIVICLINMAATMLLLFIQ